MEQKKEEVKRKRRVPFSQLLVSTVVLVSVGYIVWLCYEMHRLDDLTPATVMSTAVIGLLSVIVSAYMWRAKQSDLYELELSKTKEIAKLKEKYPNLEPQTIQIVGEDNLQQNYSTGQFFGGDSGYISGE